MRSARSMMQEMTQAMTEAWLLYGANGYTGELVAREAWRRGLSPVLAGRRREPVEALARELGLDWKSSHWRIRMTSRASSAPSAPCCTAPGPSG